MAIIRPLCRQERAGMCEEAQVKRPGTKLSQIPMFEARQVVDGYGTARGYGNTVAEAQAELEKAIMDLIGDAA